MNIICYQPKISRQPSKLLNHSQISISDRQLLSSSYNTYYFTLVICNAFDGMTGKYQNEGSMITAKSIHLWIFLNSEYHHFHTKILKSAQVGARGVGVDVSLHLQLPSMYMLNQRS
jgi:hypothetical protein